MYAVRKPFSAGTYVDIPDWHFAVDYKTALLIAQVLGYTLSKLIGVRVVAELGRDGRARLILGLIAAAWASLVLFALIPAPWNVACLFLNGLPLGMIWGLVFSYLEGRRTTELLSAMLCANFILSSGVVKSIAVLLLGVGIAEHWMPALVGLLFAPVLLVSLRMLERMPPPSDLDVAERTERVSMMKADRRAFLREHGFALLLLITGYVLLTAVRDFRDNFAAELWGALGFSGQAAVFTASEVPVAVLALGALALLMLVRDNLRALMAMHGLIFCGALLLGLSSLAFQLGLIGPLVWMTLTGAGVYLGYVPYNAVLFDRMIAVIGKAGNAGFLIYLADASGYVGSVALLLYRSLAAPDMSWVPFFSNCTYLAAVAVCLCTAISAATFLSHRTRRRELVTA